MSSCPSREVLEQFLDGRIEPSTGDRVSLHVNECPTCLAALETLTHYDHYATEPPAGTPAQDRPSPQFLNRLKAAGSGAAPPKAPPRAPTIPGYEIQDELGRGGAGIVYKARQVSLDRTVALKVMLGGEHVPAVELARFRAEALAAGKLSHPGIVRVYEVGQWVPAAGARALPYVSLEYVAGGSWERALARTPQPPRAAAEAIAHLATAVHAAHREAIVHRDIKPANVLIDAATGALKIADFGLAKQLQLDSGLTATGAIMGTPSYMAPEQARGDRAVDVRTDVYGLGAVLYELLTGRPPFQGPTPLDTLVQVAGADPIPPRRLQPTVPRDLETICLKCLEKDPARRYQSAAELTDDANRFLTGRPIVARPLGPLGRAAKLVRRHPVVVVLVTTLAAVIAGSIVGLSALYARAVGERENAARARLKAEEEKATADAERGNAVAARVAAETAAAGEKKAGEDVKAVSEFFLKNVLAAPRPKGIGAGFDVTLQQAIDEAEGRIAGQLSDRPEIEAAVRNTLGSTYYQRQQHAKAAKQFERALVLRRQSLEPGHLQVLGAQNNLGLAYLQLGRFAEAEELLRAALAGYERALGPDAPETLRGTNALSGYLLYSGQYRAAADLLNRALTTALRARSADDVEVVHTRAALGRTFIMLSRFREAEPLVREVLRAHEGRHPTGHPEVLRARAALCDLLVQMKQFDEAERLAVAGVEPAVEAFGPQSPQALKARVLVAVVRTERGDPGAATTESRKLLAEPDGPLRSHLERLDALAGLARTLIDHGRHADAKALIEEVLARQRETVPRDSPILATTLAMRAQVLLATGRAAEAEADAREAVAIREKLPPTHWGRALAASLLGECLAAQKKFVEAEPILLASCESLRGNADASQARRDNARERVRKLYTAWGKPDLAAKWGAPADGSK